MKKTQGKQEIGSGPSGIARPYSMVDVVIFAIQDAELNVLLVKRTGSPAEPFPNCWALPGGFIDVDKDHSLEACALRKLKDKTGISSPYLEQLGSWGSASRDPRGWSTTCVYFALVPEAGLAQPISGANSSDARWVPVHGAGVKEKLAFDHEKILKSAIERLKAKVEYTSLPAYLLPREFTLSELQRVYEVILQRPLEKSAFRTRVLATKLVVEVPRFREGANRPAQLYKLRSESEPVFFQRTFRPA
jgi:8-oxo-dGTP diphosphatase